MANPVADQAASEPGAAPCARWGPLVDCVEAAPAQMIAWLTDPSLLTGRVRSTCGAGAARLRLLSLESAPLEPGLRQRLRVRDSRCLLRDIEICCGEQRWVYARSVFPDSTVERFPWLRELGHSGLGESLAQAEGVQRGGFEYRLLPPRHALAIAAATDSTVHHPLWARRAVYRLDGCPILVQEVFMPVLSNGS